MAARNTQTSSHTLCIDHFNELYFACKEISYQWEELATHLNIGRSVVEEIRRDGQGVVDCLQRLLTFWLNKGASTSHNPPSWKTLSESLESVNRAIAEQIALEHQCGCRLCTGFLGAKGVDVLSPYYDILYLQLTDPLSVAEQLFCEGVFSSDAMERVRTSSNNAKEMLLTHLEGAISTDVRSIRVFAALLLKDSKTYRIGMSLLEETSGKDTSQRYQVDADYEEEFQDKRSELGKVFEKTQQFLEAKVISPSELTSYLGYSFPELKPGLSSCGTIPEVLDLVRSHTSLVNISILKAVADRFSLTDEEDFISNFKKSVDDFCERMKMQHAYGQRFAESFRQCPLKSETITFVLDWNANEKYLEDLTGLFKKVFKKYSSDLKIQVIREGNSIIVECYTPSYLQGVFTRLVQEAEKALSEKEVKSVTIGGLVVFKRNTSKSLVQVSATVRSEDEKFNVVSGTEEDVIIAKANAISEQRLKCIAESGGSSSDSDDVLIAKAVAVCQRRITDLNRSIEVLKQELLSMKGFLNAKETIIKNLSVEVDLLKLKDEANISLKGSLKGKAEMPSILEKEETDGHSLEELGESSVVTEEETVLSTELLQAARKGDNDSVELLLSQGASIDHSNKEGGNALMLAALNGHSETVQLLLQNGAKIEEKENNGFSALMIAAQNGHSETVQLLLQSGASIEEKTNNGFSALMIAAQNGHSETVQLLLQSGGNIEEKTNKWFSALMIAAQNGHSETVQLLLQNGAKIEEKTNNGISALMIAARNGHSETVQMLLHSGAKIEEKTNDGFSALMLAAQNGHSENVQLLLRCGAKIEEKENDNWNSLMLAAHNGHSETAQLLLQNGAKIEEKTNEGGNALMIAAQNGHSETVELLLQNGAKIEEKTNNWFSALMLAAQNGHSETVQLLLQSGAKIEEKENQGGNALMLAAQNGHSETVRLLLQNGAKIEEKSKKGYNALMIAAQNGRSETVQLLLQSGAKIEEKEKNGTTALMLATGSKKSETVKLLLSHKADVYQMNKFGHSAVMIAAVVGGSEIVNIFISSGVPKAEIFKYELPVHWVAEWDRSTFTVVFYDKRYPHNKLRKHPTQRELYEYLV